MGQGQMSISLRPDVLAALKRLAALEHQSVSKMAAILIEQQLAQLRQEYQADSTLSILPKQHILSTRCWDEECIKMFGK